MWSFKRKGRELTTGVPTDTEQPMWSVWLLSGGTFVVTIAIVLGLFWAGRGVVHHFSRKPVVQPTAAQKTTSAKVSQPKANPSPSTTPAPNSNPAPATTTPSTGPSPNLVNTGPTSDD